MGDFLHIDSADQILQPHIRPAIIVSFVHHIASFDTRRLVLDIRASTGFNGLPCPRKPSYNYFYKLHLHVPSFSFIPSKVVCVVPSNAQTFVARLHRHNHATCVRWECAQACLLRRSKRRRTTGKKGARLSSTFGCVNDNSRRVGFARLSLRHGAKTDALREVLTACLVAREMDVHRLRYREGCWTS